MKKKKLFIFFSVVASAVAFLLLAEAVIRLEALIKGGRIWTPDKRLYVQHIPNTSFRNVGYYKEYSAKGRVNNWGFIGKDRSIDKPEGSYRIIVVGDSFTEAVQVDSDKNYCSLLETLLGQRYEVINTGLSDYSPKLEYMYLREKLVHFGPDRIMLQLFANDVHDDYRHRAMEEGPFNLGPRRSFIYNHSKFYHYCLRQREKLREKLFGKRGTVEDTNIDKFFFMKKGNQALKTRLWAVTEQYLSRIKELADGRGIRLSVFIIPMESQISPPDQMSMASQFYFKEPPTDDFEKAVRMFCEANKVDFIDMLTVFRDNKKLDLYFEKEGHLTELGHNLVAETLYEYLQNLL
jgi:lysophospholipase L1-like esterase